MEQKMEWFEMVKTYPDEWVALANYHCNNKDPLDIEGLVILHHPDRKAFHRQLSKLLQKYNDVAIHYTGSLIKNPETPLLWQIIPTE